MVYGKRKPASPTLV